ncbi:hypothetical protein PC9H_008007 [Pleurotus ostreatus]|uniref:DNA2/NAM7 helicase-like C-terminal domain-containing protein n=1 Tax=Pleurotus ostreatus TaxID=5322 RepID=A0A8H6ZSD4_PLEOS|nr:uncharacterized protein PC9H_008007 [Pleurotus ostreatus]KAF7428775.1 hypothetical protein PC9H_008007 [Pleurotus ostreatus]
MPKGRLSATNLATYYHLNCDLYLHNVYHQSSGPESVLASQVVQAHFNRGMDWEKLLFRWLDNHCLLLPIPSAPIQAEDLAERILADSRDHFFVSGLTLRPPQQAFHELFREKGNEDVTFSVAKPDLLEIFRTADGMVVWRVVDAKSSENVKASHYVQIYFYTLCLTYILPQPRFRPSGSTAVWLPPSESSHSQPSFTDLKSINLSLLAPSLHTFLFGRLPRILEQPNGEPNWHYNPLCRNCPYEDACRSRTLVQGAVGSIPNLSHADANSVQNLLNVVQPDSGLSDIEQLHVVFQNQTRWKHLEKAYPTTFRKATKALGVAKRKGKTGVTMSTPLLDSAKSGEIQVSPFRRSFTCPRSEDIAIVVSLLKDPSIRAAPIAYFCVSVFSNTASYKPPKPATGKVDQMVPTLASIIRSILSQTSILSTQCYVFSSAEHTALQSHLVEAALASDHSDADIRMCIGALASGASLLQTTYQPLILSGVFLSFLDRPHQVATDAEFRLYAERLGLNVSGFPEEIRCMVRVKLEALKAEANTPSLTPEDESRRTLLGQVPRVVTVKSEVEKLLALPMPGYWELEECAKVLVSEPSVPECPTGDEMLSNCITGSVEQLESQLKLRNWYVYATLNSLRTRASHGRPDLLVNPGRRLSANCMDICKDEQLRKLFFMQQFEVLTKLVELWKTRIEGCPDAPVIEFQNIAQGSRGLEYCFIVTAGALDMPIEKEKSFYEYIIVADNEDDEDIPVEALFDDLTIAGSVIPLNNFTRKRWDFQHPAVRDNLALVDLQDVSIRGRGRSKVTALTLNLWTGGTFQVEVGKKYRLSPRLVDFNITKVLATLFELDVRAGAGDVEQPDSPFWQLIKNPRRLRHVNTVTDDVIQASTSIQRLFREIHDLGNESAGALMLQASQLQAAKRILSNQLSVVWGPPGTGKTHTIALSILRLLDAETRTGRIRTRVVFVSAMTHAAIQACLDKFHFLTTCYKEISDLDTAWLDEVKIEKVLNGNKHPPPNLARFRYIYAGTVYQLHNFSKRNSFDVDVVVVDEAGQLSLASVALVLGALKPDGKMIFAGDSEQLAPILTGSYPIAMKRLFGSVLDYLMRPPAPTAYDGEGPSSQGSLEGSSQGSIVQLTENFRLNPDLGEFISTIYRRSFKPQKAQERELGKFFQTIRPQLGQDIGIPLGIADAIRHFLLALSNVMQRKPQELLLPPTIGQADDPSVPASSMDHLSSKALDEPHLPVSLAMIQLETTASRLESTGYEGHVRAEAAVAAALVASIQSCMPEASIFVATPYRVQRQAVRNILKKTHFPHSPSGSKMKANGSVDQLVDATRRMKLSETPISMKNVTVDTIERLQGAEAAFVICLFSIPPSAGVDVSFLLERRRLNVAISRAKTLCILVTSSEVLRPAIRVLTNEGTAKGYAFLKGFAERAWSTGLSINLDAFETAGNLY